MYAVAALIGIALLTGVGIIALTTLGSGLGTFTSGDAGTTAPAPEDVQGELDPEATVAVLNGTATPNLQAGVDEVITENGWGSIVFSDAAASRDVEISAVFFSDPADEAAARGLAQQLGGVSTYQSDAYADYGARLVVLLGADYAGPGFDEAEDITARLGSSRATTTPQGDEGA